jgi:hypothetical protein
MMMHNHFEENSLGWHQAVTFWGADGHHFPPTLWQPTKRVGTSSKGKARCGSSADTICLPRDDGQWNLTPNKSYNCFIY